jgi:hypothetical protein
MRNYWILAGQPEFDSRQEQVFLAYFPYFEKNKAGS